ncbi:flippase [Geobacillus jurassicus]|uniref:Flippase n=1 Tax=Geobacillus jurassicus TaxID=235932 RepID=A0ABV6GWW7_9BACL|nr:flippase [Geobacillus jurassicus]
MERLIFLKKILKNEFIVKIIESLFGRASGILFSMLFSLVCTRLYGAEAFGQYTYAFTLVTFVTIFAVAGLDNGLIYYIPKVGNKYVTLSIIVSTVLSIIFILITSLFVKDQFVKLMLPLVLLFALEQIFFSIYRAEGKIREFYIFNGFISMLMRILLIVLFYFIFGSNVENIALAVYISLMFSVLVYFYQNKSSFKKFSYNKNFLKYSFPLVIASIAGTIMDKIDIIMLGMMLTKKEVGIYQITVQITNMIAMYLLIFNTVFAPKISQLYHSHKIQELRRIYILSTRVLGLFSLITIIGLIGLSKYILELFGQEFIEGQVALIFRGIGQFINVAVGSVWIMLSMTGKPKLHVYGNLFACLINIGLNYLLIPIYGISGAAFASMIALSFVNILGYILVCREFRVKVYGVL